MNNMTSANLILAITLLGTRGIPVTCIEFEDGSGKRFNYKTVNSNTWQFIDLSDELDSISRRAEYAGYTDAEIEKML